MPRVGVAIRVIGFTTGGLVATGLMVGSGVGVSEYWDGARSIIGTGAAVGAKD